MAHRIGEPFRVMELFNTIQGEGTDLGRETIFMRLYGCNLSCVWCDTAHSWDENLYFEGIYSEYKKSEIIENISVLAEEHGINALVITGGEPLLHDHADLASIIGELRAKERINHITFETNGTILPRPELVKVTTLFSVSPKLTSSENKPYSPRLLGRWIDRVGEDYSRIQFKFVIANQEDADEVADLLVFAEDQRLYKVPIIFQPEESANNYIDLPRMVGQAFKRLGHTKDEFDIRYIPQMHKQYGIR